MEKGQVKSTRDRQACIRNLMTVQEAKGLCMNRSKWKEVISTYPKGGVMLCIYYFRSPVVSGTVKKNRPIFIHRFRKRRLKG
jgi:hypothetical protein